MTSRPIPGRGCATSCSECAVRVGRLHLVAGLVLAAGKVTTGLIARSKALAVSSMFALQDSVSAGVMLLVARPPSRTRPHGHGKVEFVVAGGTSLLVVSGVIALCGAILHSLLEHRQRIPDQPALWAALAGVAASWLIARQARCLETRIKDRTVAAHASSTHAHLIAALAVTAAVMLATIGWVPIDLLTAVLEAAYVIVASANTLRKAVRGLMDASIEPNRIETIRSVMQHLNQPLEVISLRAVRAGQRISVFAAVGLPGSMSLEQAAQLRQRIESAIARGNPDVAEVLVEIRQARTTQGNHPRLAVVPPHGDVVR